MQQIAHTGPCQQGATAPALSGEECMRLLEARLRGYEALAHSLIGCRSAFIASDLDAIMQWVELQSSHCAEIRRTEEKLTRGGIRLSGGPPGFFSHAEAERADGLLRRAAEMKPAIQQLNRTYSGLVRKAAYNNAVLRNLYATALVYADPRHGPGLPGAGTEG